ncbi:ricin-type beta-trefoil lectin domain protein [Micromonospora parva]|uniref:protein kinase domain-containing protein n=1 Tax=Micromonospora parva TaxID=1464048 RepID=UPI0037A55B7D
MPDASRQLIADRYRLVRPLGQGGMGRVWQARDEMLQRDVAIKELVAPPGLRDDERREMRERSMREARAVARLGHPNVVRVFDVLHSGGDPWIVMELVPSRSLQQVLEAEGSMPADRAARIGLGILGALRAAHRAGVLHRDVKPANVLLADDGRVVLTDFGLATLPGDPRMTQTGMVLGSPAFLAPERATDGDVGPAADLWSLGATLYAAVEGRTPYHRSSPLATLAALATEPPPPARRAGPLTPLLEGLLRREPGQRISAEEADRLLRRAATGDVPATEVSGAGGVPLTRITTATADLPRPTIVPEFVPAEPGPPTSPALPDACDAPAAPAANAAPPATTSPAATASPAAAQAGVAAAPMSPAVPPPPAAAPVPGKGRQRRARLIGSIAAAVLLVVLLVAASVLKGGLFGDPGADDVAAPAVGPSPVAETPVSRVLPPPPAGWRYYRDDPRFLVPVPDGWQARRDGERAVFREPDGSRVLVVDELRSVPADPLAQLRARETAQRGRYADYRRVRLDALRYQLWAAEWAWTYTDEDGTPMHTSSRVFVGHNGHAYSIDWTTSAAEWSASEAVLALITDGFQGLPVAGAPPSRAASAPPSAGAPPPSPGTGGNTTTAPGNQAPPSAAPPSPTKSNPPAGKQISSFASDRCIDIPEGNAYAGARPQIWDCRRTAKQLWTFPSDGTVRSMGLCLDVAGHSTQDGAHVILAECSGASSQRFILNKAYDLVNTKADRCVDVVDSNPDNGARLQIWQCTGNANQKWRAS